MQKYIIAVIVSFFVLPYALAAGVDKTICKDILGKDGKAIMSAEGKPKQTCKTIKTHKKLEGTPVPTKIPAKSVTPAGFNLEVQARQRQLIAAGAKIQDDGILGPGTRKAESEFGHLITK